MTDLVELTIILRLNLSKIFPSWLITLFSIHSCISFWFSSAAGGGGGGRTPKSSLPLQRPLPPKILSESNRKISKTIEICTTIQCRFPFPLPPKIMPGRKPAFHLHLLKTCKDGYLALEHSDICEKTLTSSLFHYASLEQVRSWSK